MDALNKLAFFAAPIFYKLLAMSITAGGIGFVLLLVRRAADEKLPPRWKYMLWVLVLAALVVPYRQETERAVMPSMNVIENISYREEYDKARNLLFIETQRGEDPIQMSESGIRELERKEQLLFAKSLLADVVVPLIWFFGSLSMMVLWVLVKFRLEREIRKKGVLLHVEEEFLQKCRKAMGVREQAECILLPGIASPALVGVFRPRILLPEYVRSLSEESFSYILMHELAHFKRRDMWWNLLLLGLRTVYWFNPVIWFLFRCIREDMELQNDAYVLERIDPSSRKAYAYSLVEVLEHAHHRSWMVLCMTDEKKNVERRIRMIRMGEVFRKKKKWISIFGISLLMLLTACFFTESKSLREGLHWMKNLKTEEILRLEMVVSTEEDGERYHRFGKEEQAQWVDWMRGLEGDYVEEVQEEDGEKVDFYVLTRDRRMHKIRCHAGKHLIIDGEAYRPREGFLDGCPKAKAKARIPEYFHYGEKREAFKGLELYIRKDREGKPGFTLLPGTDALKTKEQIYDEEVSTSDLEEVAAELAMQKEGLHLFVMRMNTDDFSEEEMMKLLEPLTSYLPEDVNMSIGEYQRTSNTGDSPVIPVEILKLSPEELWKEAFEGMESSSPRELEAIEIERINASLMQLLPQDLSGEKYILNPVCHFFSSRYERSEELDFSEFLWYFPGEEMSDEREEDVIQFELLKKLPDFPFSSAKKLSDTVSPLRRVRRSSVEEVLAYYAGLTSKQLKNQRNIFYLQEYDSYYVYSSDFGAGYFDCVSGEITEDGIHLRSGEGLLLRLEYRDGRYLIRSHGNGGEN